MRPVTVFIADAVLRERCGADLPADSPIQVADRAPEPGVALCIHASGNINAALFTVLGRLLATESPECRILRVAALRFPAALMPVMEQLVMLAPGNPSVARLAAVAGVSRRTLAGQLTRTGLPPAGALIGWVRALLAVHQLCTTNRSAVRIATELAFASDRSLRHHLYSYDIVGPRILRSTPANFDLLLARFSQLLKPPSRQLSLKLSPPTSHRCEASPSVPNDASYLLHPWCANDAPASRYADL